VGLGGGGGGGGGARGRGGGGGGGGVIEDWSSANPPSSHHRRPPFHPFILRVLTPPNLPSLVSKSRRARGTLRLFQDRLGGFVWRVGSGGKGGATPTQKRDIGWINLERHFVSSLEREAAGRLLR
jgi:hypothetical protein